MGEIEYDSGDIEASIGHFKKSFKVMGNLRALVKLSEVYYMLGEFTSGIKTLDRAKEIQPEGQSPTGYWQAILLENRGNLTEMLGKKEEALRHYRNALIEWDSAKVPAERAPLIAIRRGILLDRLGDLKGSKEAFTQAVRLDPNRESTYAQLISFLVIRGRLEDAKQFYRLAHNQDQIEDMWKIYYSLWVEGLSLRTVKSSFELAGVYLRHSKGDSWQDCLAQFFSGSMTEEELRKKASNFGEEVEVEYYAALKAMSLGETSEARKRLEKVIASKLLGFFEYQMASALLRFEPSVQTP
jgi:lipoprotein NlpI